MIFTMPQPNQASVDLFSECFGGWMKDVDKIEYEGTNDIRVKLKTGKLYSFGTKENGDIYLKTIPNSQKSQAL